MRALLHRDDFMVFMQEQPSMYLGKEEFAEQAMPAGLSVDTAWDFVSFMRRMAALPSVRSYVPQAERGVFDLAHWNTPIEALEMLNDVYAKTAENSQLWEALAPLLRRGRLVGVLTEELLACAQRDNLGLDYEAIRELVMGERTPEGDGERIVANTARLLHEIDLWEGPVDAEMLSQLYERITEGVGQHPGRRGSLPPTPYAELFFRAEECSFEDAAKQLVNDGTWGSHPLLGIIMNSAIIWGRWPFPHCNEFMEVVVRWINARHIGVPALRGVPLMRLRFDWERGLVDTAVTPFRYGEAVAISDFGVDNTPYLMVVAALLREGVERLELTVDRILKSDEARKGAIADDFRLTHRQQRILCDMVDDPRLSVDVSTYATRFDIAVSTAREDLNRLVSLGFCLTEMRGKKQVFWPRAVAPSAVL